MAATLAYETVLYTRDAQKQEEAASGAFELVVAAQRVTVDLMNAQRGFRGYLITDDGRLLEAYDRGVHGAQADFASLRSIGTRLPAFRSDLLTIESSGNKALQIYSRGVALSKIGNHAEALYLEKSGAGKRYLDETEIALDKVQKRALWQREHREEEAATGNRKAARAAAFLAIMSGALCLTAAVFGWAALRQRKRSAQNMVSEYNRLQEFFEEAPVFIAVGSVPDFRFEYVNRAYQDLVGRSNLVGQTVVEALPEIVAQGFMDMLLEAAAGQVISRRDQPVTLHINDRSEPIQAYVDFVFQPIRNAEGRVVRVFCVGYDVTREHTTRKQAALLAQELKDAGQATVLSNLASTIAHELNQPLGAASNYLGAIRHVMEAAGPNCALRVKDLVEQANQQVLRAGEIIRGIMALAGRRPPKRELVELQGVIRAAVDTVRVSGNFSATIRRRVVRKPVLVEADRVQLEEVIVNLIRNASQAMTSTLRPVLDIQLKTDGERASIEIADNGPGFTPSTLNAPHKIGQSTTGGLGLGLAVARTIIEAHNGRLTLQNQPTGGAVVCLVLSLAPTLNSPAKAEIP